MWFKKEEKINSQEYLELRRRIDVLELDLTLITDKLQKATHRRIIKKIDEKEKDDNSLNDVILPI